MSYLLLRGEEGHVQRNCWKLDGTPTQYANATIAQETVDSLAQIITAPESKSITISDEEYA